jgi:N6-L-threonylcarbamoyladenine synthase
MAILNDRRCVLAHQIASQVDIHRYFGGVVPEIAARNHLSAIDLVLDEVLKQAQLTVDDLDVIAATAGPGLIGGLVVGITFAKTLAAIKQKPFLAINHLEAHALIIRLMKLVDFPFFLLLLSGGHCQLLVAHDVGHYQKLGETLDDSLGETFDKVAKLVGLEYPGGPPLEALAQTGDPFRFRFPQPLVNKGTKQVQSQHKFNLSFSGLKTAVRYKIQEMGSLTLQDKKDICASFQQTVIEILSNKLQNMLTFDKSIKTVVMGGGVCANRCIRRMLEKICLQENCHLLVPPIDLCTDNGVMVANAALERYQHGLVDDLNIKPRARWDLEEL